MAKPVLPPANRAAADWGSSARRRGQTRRTHVPGAHHARHTNIFYETALTCRNAQKPIGILTILRGFSLYLWDCRSESRRKRPASIAAGRRRPTRRLRFSLENWDRRSGH